MQLMMVEAVCGVTPRSINQSSMKRFMQV